MAFTSGFDLKPCVFCEYKGFFDSREDFEEMDLDHGIDSDRSHRGDCWGRVPVVQADP